MILLNYALAGGNKSLMQVQAENRELMFQVWYEDVVSSTVALEVWVSTSSTGPFAKVPAASKTLVPDEDTAFIMLSGVSFAHIQFRLTADTGTAGSIKAIDSIGCVIASTIAV